MEQTPDASQDALIQRISLAITELAKGMKSVSFYPQGHPALAQAMDRIVAALDEIPLPEAGMEIGVTKSALLYRDVPLTGSSKAVGDLNRELYLRRAAKVIFLPGQKPREIYSFLSILSRDLQKIQDEGGLERAFLREHISRIWANRVDYEGLTEMLKREEEEPLPELEPEVLEGMDEEEPAAPPPETLTIEQLLARIARETDPAAYRDAVIVLCRDILAEQGERKLEHSRSALSLFVAHAARPPAKHQEIAESARMGIKELVSDEVVAYFIRRLQDRAAAGRREAETILAAVGERAVKPLLAALADESDLLVRKSIVDVVAQIGPPAVPGILENLNDSRWYMVRNMVTIIGSLGVPELAANVAAVLSHPDFRVKKEAIKALSKLPHPAAAAALSDMCFFPEETVALTATAALSSKREPEAVSALYRRAVQKRFLYPRYRLAHEAIDALRSIGTDEALTALEYILKTRAVWETERFRAMKIHALRSIAKVSGNRAKEILNNALGASEKYIGAEARRLTRKTS
ncbi:MAG: HEAT repeat domain-containing protein [Gemmatimonadota bacterium]